MSMLRKAIVALTWAASVLTGAAQADNAALERCRQETAAAQRLACYDAIPTRPPAAAAAASVPMATPASRFGLPVPLPDAVESRITGRFEGWGPKTRFTLANGQVWEVEDGSNATLWLDSPAVRVRRGFAGAYYLVIDGTNRSPRVRRLQ